MIALSLNSLDLKIVLGVGNEKVSLKGMLSDDLPWLGGDGGDGVPYTIQPRSIEGSLLFTLVNGATALGNQLVPRTESLAKPLSDHLEEMLESLP